MLTPSIRWFIQFNAPHERIYLMGYGYMLLSGVPELVAMARFALAAPPVLWRSSEYFRFYCLAPIIS